MLETVVVVALCQDLSKQRQCQAAGRGSPFSEALYCSRFKGKRARGGSAPGPENLGRLSHGYHCDQILLDLVVKLQAIDIVYFIVVWL